MEKEKNHHFVLVHGACHGAWCWYKIVTILKSQGYKVSVLDMAASGINTKTTEEVNSMAEYNQPLIHFMASLPQEERIVLVGHSMGGINISLAMERFPEKIKVAVFVTAFMPGPNLNIPAISLQDLTLATYLARPVPLFDESGLLNDTTLTNEKYGSVRRVYVVCNKDKVLKEEQFQRWLIKNNPPDVVEQSDADHMVMFSKPQELCSCLVMISEKY